LRRSRLFMAGLTAALEEMLSGLPILRDKDSFLRPQAVEVTHKVTLTQIHAMVTHVGVTGLGHRAAVLFVLGHGQSLLFTVTVASSGDQLARKASGEA
jgi:hypothetical protein